MEVPKEESTIITRSFGCRPFTSAPTAATVPTPSIPAIAGTSDLIPYLFQLLKVHYEYVNFIIQEEKW